MQELPHNYKVSARADTEGLITLSSKNVDSIISAPPEEFGGPGDQWSPETLLVSAVADCFILTFRAIARASKLPWSSLQCEVDGTLNRIDGVTRFTAFNVRAILTIPAGTDTNKAERLLEKSDKGCLITNSMMAESQLEATVITV